MKLPEPITKGVPNEVAENWLRIESEELGFVFYHRGAISRKTLATIIKGIRYSLRKRELLK